MKTLSKFILWAVALTSASCSNSQPQAPANLNPNIHHGVALEVLNASKYTYLLVDENGTQKWLAFPLSEVKTGETYYYTNEMKMENFPSKDLGRTFSEVSFVEGVSLDPMSFAPAQNAMPPQNGAQQAMPEGHEMTQQAPHKGNAEIKTEKVQVNIDKAKDGLTVSQLLEGKSKYAGKKVILKGQVIKYNEGIMGKNWVHLQDGTELGGVFEIVASSSVDFKVGEIVTIEGTVVLNKDLGAGYVYEILLEDAVKK